MGHRTEQGVAVSVDAVRNHDAAIGHALQRQTHAIVKTTVRVCALLKNAHEFATDSNGEGDRMSEPVGRDNTLLIVCVTQCPILSPCSRLAKACAANSGLATRDTPIVTMTSITRSMTM